MEGVAGKRENLNLSLRVNGPDLIHRSPTQARYERQNGGGGGNGEDLQLSLGLSMNGRFGVDPASKKLKRSSTISDFVFTVDNNGGSSSSQQARGVACEFHAPLARTVSLPIDREEWRQRKELESVKQMEARKKRMEKLKNVRVVKCNENPCEDFSNGNGSHDASLLAGELGKPQLSSGWLSEKNPIVNDQNGLENGNVLPSSQESIGSQRSGSSGFSDLQGQQIEAGPRQNAVLKSPSRFRSVQSQVKQEPVVRADDRNVKRDSNQALKSALLDMPYVCTKDDGMNRIEGFLYRYKNGEEVKIVCVCHGMFLSPAEFIKHAGGGDVEHPLKHIVVNTTPLF